MFPTNKRPLVCPPGKSIFFTYLAPPWQYLIGTPLLLIFGPLISIWRTNFFFQGGEMCQKTLYAHFVRTNIVLFIHQWNILMVCRSWFSRREENWTRKHKNNVFKYRAVIFYCLFTLNHCCSLYQWLLEPKKREPKVVLPFWQLFLPLFVKFYFYFPWHADFTLKQKDHDYLGKRHLSNKNTAYK